MFRGGGHVNSRRWVWWAFAMLAVVAVVLIAASSKLRETIDEPWAKPLSDVLQISTIFIGGMGSSVIQKRSRRLLAPKDD